MFRKGSRIWLSWNGSMNRTEWHEPPLTAPPTRPVRDRGGDKGGTREWWVKSSVVDNLS